VIDDYVTQEKAQHYREIACLAQGRTTASVIIAAAFESAWPTHIGLLQRVIRAWQVR